MTAVKSDAYSGLAADEGNRIGGSDSKEPQRSRRTALERERASLGKPRHRIFGFGIGSEGPRLEQASVGERQPVGPKGQIGRVNPERAEASAEAPSGFPTFSGPSALKTGWLGSASLLDLGSWIASAFGLAFGQEGERLHRDVGGRGPMSSFVVLSRLCN